MCMRVAAFFQTLQPEARTVVGGSYSVRNNRRAGTKRLPRYGLTGSVGDGGLAVCAEEAAAVSRGNG